MGPTYQQPPPPRTVLGTAESCLITHWQRKQLQEAVQKPMDMHLANDDVHAVQRLCAVSSRAQENITSMENI